MQNKTFRLFISSTFSDFTKERDILHKKVFPKIDQYCKEKGFSFQPIDLRWGVSNEAQLDQKTLEVCLEEVRACKHFPHPNFLIMAGDRYGYVPCPYMIEKKEFENILKVSNSEELKVLEYWYKHDENQIYTCSDKIESSAYILQQRTGEYIDYPNWEKEENILRAILQKAADEMFIDKECKEYQKYFTSATEAEVLEGICHYKYKTMLQEDCDEQIDKEYIFGYLRSINNPNEKYIDKKKSLQQNAVEFKRNLRKTLGSNIDQDKLHYEDGNILVSNFKFVEEYEEDNLEVFENYLTKQLKYAIDIQFETIQQHKQNNLIQTYLDEQEFFLKEKHKFFIRKQEELTFLNNLSLIKREDSELLPFFIYSKKGYGKSALLYNFAKKNKHCIFRNIESVLQFQQFDQLLKTIDFNNLNLNKILIIDGIEYFSDNDIVSLIEACKTNKIELILSTNSLSQFSRFTSGEPYPIIKIENHTHDHLFDIEQYIEKYMQIDKRKLTKQQIVTIKSYSSMFDNLNEYNLYLDLLKNDTHESKVSKFNLDQLINEYKKEKLKYIEKIVIEYFISYLKNIQIGLTESEILDLFNHNKYVIESIKNDYHELKENKLPISIWSKLLSLLKPFIQIKNYDGNLLYSFKNNLIVDKYKSHTIYCSKEIYQYLMMKKNNDPRTKLELAYALIYSCQYDILFKKLSDENFMTNYISQLGIASLIRLIIQTYQKLVVENNITQYNERFTQLIEKLITLDQLSVKYKLLEITSEEDAVDFLKFWIKDSRLIDPLKSDILLISIENNSKKFFDYIVEKIDDINLADKQHRIPINTAAKTNNTYMVKKLIEAGAKLEINNITNWPPILFVAENLNFELLKVFIDKKIDINIKADGLTPLIIASQQKQKDKVYEFAKLLIENGANVNDEQFSKKRTFEEKFDGISLIRSMIDASFESISFDEKDNFMYSKHTALDYAVDRMNHKLVELLLHNKADPNHIDNFEHTSLLTLCKYYDNLEMLKLLLEYGGDLNIKDGEGYDSRVYTVSENNIDLMNYLFDIGEIPCQWNPNEPDDYLFAALNGDNIEYFKRLVNDGVDLTQKNSQGRNLLFLAGDCNTKKCLEYFINEIGLDLNDQDADGNTPLNFLIQSEILTIENIKECEKIQSNSNKVMNCPFDIAKTYLELGANPNLQDEEGSTPLYWALSKDLYDFCELLINYGADPDLAVRSGTTSFVYAAAKSDLKYLKLFLPKISDINLKVKNGLTALMLASKLDPMSVMQGKSNYEKVKYLLDNGADKTLIADNGYKAYDYAVEPEVKELLLDSNSLTEDNIHEFLSNANSDQVYELYIYSSNNKNILEHTFKRFLLTIKDLIAKNDFVTAKGLSRELSEKISNELYELSKDIKEFSDYINEFITYDSVIPKIHFYVNPENQTVKNLIDYFDLIFKSYSKNEDLWWSGYIACCINLGQSFHKKQFKESYLFANEALNIINASSESKLNNPQDYHIINQFKQQESSLAQILMSSNEFEKSLMNNIEVQSNNTFCSFLINRIRLFEPTSETNYTETFESLLNISKALSIVYNDANDIRISELYHALHFVELNEKTENIFRQLFGNQMDYLNKDTDGCTLIEIGKNYPIINYDDDVKNIVSQLKNIFKNERILNIRKEIHIMNNEIDEEIPF